MLKAQQEPQAHREMMELKVMTVQQAHKALKDQQEHKAHKEFKGHKD